LCNPGAAGEASLGTLWDTLEFLFMYFPF